MRTEVKQRLAARRRGRVRVKVAGTAERPRMTVKFTGKHIYVQFVDDERGCTLAQASTRLAEVRRGGEQVRPNVEGGRRLGVIAAGAARRQGIEAVVFDRGSAQFHGKVKALAEAAREAGLKF